MNSKFRQEEQMHPINLQPAHSNWKCRNHPMKQKTNEMKIVMNMNENESEFLSCVALS